MMTIKGNRFALFPKACDKCGRIFLLEWYNKKLTTCGGGAYDYYKIICSKCAHPRIEAELFTPGSYEDIIDES